MKTELKKSFPGIRPFNKSEARLFFGRDEQISTLYKKLENCRFIAVIGTSGCGKSSLINAGLFPKLHESGEWTICYSRPQNNPILYLSEALKEIEFNNGEDQELKKSWKTYIKTNLDFSSKGIIDTYKQSNSNKKLLLIIDQFEELFTFRDRSIEKEKAIDASFQYVNLLVTAINQKEYPIHVIITMRSDFLGDCARYKGLPELINDGQFLIPRLTREQFKLAITGPLKKQNITISTVLVSTLLNDIEDDPDQLPVLQHALMRTWNKWISSRSEDSFNIELKDYEIAGGMLDGIDQHADEIFLLLSDQEKDALSIVFKRITESKEGKRFRRPTEIGILKKLTHLSADQLGDLLNKFSCEGVNFLVPYLETEKITDQIKIDISHESIIRKWKRLVSWVDEEESDKNKLRKLYERLSDYFISSKNLLINPFLDEVINWSKIKTLVKSSSLENDKNYFWIQDYSYLNTKKIPINETLKFVKKSDRKYKRDRIINQWLPLAVAIVIGLVIFDIYDSRQKDKLKEQEQKVFELRRDTLRNKLFISDSIRTALEIDNKKLVTENIDLHIILKQTESSSARELTTFYESFKERQNALIQSSSETADQLKRSQERGDKLAQDLDSTKRASLEYKSLSLSLDSKIDQLQNELNRSEIELDRLGLEIKKLKSESINSRILNDKVNLLTFLVLNESFHKDDSITSLLIKRIYANTSSDKLYNLKVKEIRIFHRNKLTEAYTLGGKVVQNGFSNSVNVVSFDDSENPIPGIDTFTSVNLVYVQKDQYDFGQSLSDILFANSNQKSKVEIIDGSRGELNIAYVVLGGK